MKPLNYLVKESRIKEVLNVGAIMFDLGANTSTNDPLRYRFLLRRKPLLN
jgi:hypothetical protein